MLLASKKKKTLCLYRKLKFESQSQIVMSNLLTNPKFTYVTKLIKLNIKEQIKWYNV
jgi:hypothetical protein